VKIAALKGDAAAARRVEERLCDLPGVRGADANPVTGSVLVLFEDGKTWPESLSDLAEAFRLAAPGADVEALAGQLAASRETPGRTRGLTAHDVKGFFGDLNETVRSTTDGLDLTLLLPLALVLLGLRGLVTEGPATPRWYDFLWFGFGTFMMLNAAGVPTARAAEEALEVAESV
jgi:hypothetical protein